MCSLWSGSCRYLYWLGCTVRGRSARPCKWEFSQQQQQRQQCVDSEYQRHQFTVSSTQLTVSESPKLYRPSASSNNHRAVKPIDPCWIAGCQTFTAGHPRWVIRPDDVDPCSLRHANPSTVYAELACGFDKTETITGCQSYILMKHVLWPGVRSAMTCVQIQCVYVGDFALMRSVWPKLSGRSGRPSIIFAPTVRPMNALQLCRWQFSHKDFLHAILSAIRPNANWQKDIFL